jgi:uncharacterized protein (TIGR04255 family)
MSKPVHLKNAPITEAVIDFRVRIPTGVSLDHFRVAHESFANDYPRREERHSTEFSLPIGGAPTAPSTKRSVQGYFFHSHDGLQIVQFRLDGFTFSRLRPYHTWDAFLSEALRLWKVYEKVVNHAEISRVAVRYINHIRLPLPVELHEHLTAPPAVPSRLSHRPLRKALIPPWVRLSWTSTALRQSPSLVAGVICKELWRNLGI